jgi:hypothetical protein
MGQKLCAGSSDTPLVTLDCTFISVTRSPNTNIDITDSPVSDQEEEEEKDPQYKRCCCLLWRRRHRKENGGERMKAKEKKAFQLIPSTLPMNS